MYTYLFIYLFIRHRKSENWNVDIFSGFAQFITLTRLKESCTWDDYIFKKPLLLGMVNGEYRLRNITELIILISAAWFGHVLSPNDVCFFVELFDFEWTMFTYKNARRQSWYKGFQ